ncbi:MAG: hypothetical protein N3D75_03530 [Candidatus Aenigmarchaeota archaeon]|nr:hypothetical protein [Candidatus Aenigmarchaeota archaeon]
MKFFIVFITLILIHSASAIDFEIDRAGFSENNDTLIVFTNTGNQPIKDIIVYIDGEYYQTMSGLTTPGSSFQFYTPMDGRNHIVKVCAENVCKQTETTGFDVRLQVYEEEKQKDYSWVPITIGVIALIALIIVFWRMK